MIEVKKHGLTLGILGMICGSLTFLVFKFFSIGAPPWYAIDPRHCPGEASTGSVLFSLAGLSWLAALCLSLSAIIVGAVALKARPVLIGIVSLVLVLGNFGLMPSADSMWIEDDWAIDGVRSITRAQWTYKSTGTGVFGTIPDLIGAGLLEPEFDRPFMGNYAYRIVLHDNDYIVTATPRGHSPSQGCWEYYSTADTVARYSTDASKAPHGGAGKPIR
ncbi:MAG TPA: hypothetical protein VMB70_12585 [Terriglobia bacterium]|nr:hypothetical protein [Terriglobia bacterium]